MDRERYKRKKMVREINIIDFKNGKCMPQAKECEWSLEATMGKKMGSPLQHMKKPSPTNTMILAQGDLEQIYDCIK